MGRQWLRSLTNLFYPNLCVSCGRELTEGESQLCTFCRWEMPMTEFHLQSENYVTELFAARFPFENACSLFYFRGNNDRYRNMIHRMKYSSRRDIAYLLGEIFGTVLRESRLYDHVEVLIPIPLHWTRRITRGYNQSEELCRGMAATMEIPVDFSIVKRKKVTAQQARRSSRDRWKNVSGAFAVTDSERLNGKHILLVDDVLTTGSTIESCATEIIGRIPDVKLSIATLAVAKRGQLHRSQRIVERTIIEHDSTTKSH